MEFGRLKVETEYLRTEIGFLIASRWFMQFTFEKLEVYKHAIDWVKESENIIERSRHGMSRTLADQLSRASLSIPLNIAEGNGRWHAGDKRQFFWIARGSVFECVPIIDVLRIKNLISEIEREALRKRLEMIGKMLTSLIQSLETKSSAEASSSETPSS